MCSRVERPVVESEDMMDEAVEYPHEAECRADCRILLRHFSASTVLVADSGPFLLGNTSARSCIIMTSKLSTEKQNPYVQTRHGRHQLTNLGGRIKRTSSQRSRIYTTLHLVWDGRC